MRIQPLKLRPHWLAPLLARNLPQTRGAIALRGPRDGLTIRRDTHGIAYIQANNDDDAWFGLGFCQAQDRAFQLELRLRTLRGTLSEVFGEQTLAIDRLSRRIGFVEAARRQLAVLDNDIRAQIEAFVRGLNAALSIGAPRPAPEFSLLRSRPSRWRPEDVVAMGKLLSFMLVGNWDVELTRLKLLLADGPEALRDLDPSPYPEDAAVASPPGSNAGPALDALTADLERFLAFAGGGGGSNAWALAGAKTAFGGPILANDPHLDATLPPHWYLARLSAPGWSVAGASMIGCPAFATGHNGSIAWGITAGLADTTDLFIEEVGPDGRSVRRGDAFEPCEVRHERIEVRRRSPVVEEVLVTPRGPVISPALEGGLPVLSLRAVWLDAKPARGFLRLHRARDFDEVRREFREWPLLSQNLVYADTAGNIAWQLVGEVPRRRTGYGTLPSYGADAATGWDGAVPFDQMPYSLNPETGFVATANNKPRGDHPDAPYLGSDWLDGYRAGRIAEVLAGRDGWDRDATMRLQLDEVSLAWREVRETVLGAVASPGAPADAAAEYGLDLLRSWDGRVAADSAGAAVFERFLRAMAHRVAAARAPNATAWALGKGFTPLLAATTFSAGRASRLLRRLREQPPGWFEAGWPAEMRAALAEAVAGLEAELGSDKANWAWGHVRPARLEHPLGRVPALAPLFNRGPFPWGGDGNTVSQASGSSPMIVASLRAVIPLGDWEQARFVLPGGQSGNPFSPHYDDLLPLWQRGKGVPIAWAPGAVDAATVDTLRLLPLS